MTLNEMRELPPIELHSEIEKARASLWKLRFHARGEPIENPGALRRLRRDVARMLTVLNEKRRAGEDIRAQAGSAVPDAGVDAPGAASEKNREA